ncbi:HNH endonuclease [Lysinibacillus sp. NPDC093712]|uniref:HNH endonuclease n=1 Tax=Lysinibacillus sp. NPDC093712 TaxID=3390579 RepID=UPI003D03C5D6
MFNCFYCGEDLEDTLKSEEHIIPDSIGGNITTSNVCIKCNSQANQQIDVKFKDQWLISWERALAGLTDKRGKKHTEIIETSTEEGEPIQIKVCEEGFVPITKPDISKDWINDKQSTIKVDPRHQEKVLKDIEKKALKKGKQISITKVSSESVDVGKVGFQKSLDLSVIRREQVKIILGLGCLFIPNFAKSNTAAALRNYLWDKVGKGNIKNLYSRLFPRQLEKDKYPPFVVKNNILYTYPTEKMLLRNTEKILTKDREHIFIVYTYNNKIRLFLNIFGMIPAVIETIESPSYFYPGPSPYKEIAYVVNPKEKKHKEIIIDNIRSIISSLEVGRLAAYIRSHPTLYKHLKP